MKTLITLSALATLLPAQIGQGTVGFCAAGPGCSQTFNYSMSYAVNSAGGAHPGGSFRFVGSGPTGSTIFILSLGTGAFGVPYSPGPFTVLYLDLATSVAGSGTPYGAPYTLYHYHQVNVPNDPGMIGVTVYGQHAYWNGTVGAWQVGSSNSWGVTIQ